MTKNFFFTIVQKNEILIRPTVFNGNQNVNVDG